MEFEADAIAMQLMARAGFNPGAGVVFNGVIGNFISCAVFEVQKRVVLSPGLLLVPIALGPGFRSWSDARCPRVLVSACALECPARGSPGTAVQRAMAIAYDNLIWHAAHMPICVVCTVPVCHGAGGPSTRSEPVAC